MTLLRILSVLLLPIFAIVVLYRCVIGKEDFSRISEKFGFATIKRPNGDVIWIHAVSVGEAKTALILVDSYFKRFPDLNILITSTTLSSAQIIKAEIEGYKDRVFHQFLPLDSEVCVRKFLGFWRIKLAIFMESEIWPNFLNTMKKRGVPIFLVNARISDRSANRWSFFAKLGIRPFDNFDKIFVQNLHDIKLFNSICSVESLYFGNLKNEAPPLEFNENSLRSLKEQVGGRKVFLAASTHHGEESKIINIHRNLKSKYSDLLTIVVIRHPNRSEEVKKVLKDVSFLTYEDGVDISLKDEVLLVDKLGILGLFYKLCDFAFIAGSLERVGGHNPFEAIKLDCSVITGRNYFNFQEVYDQLSARKGCIIVDDDQDLESKVCDIFDGKINTEKLLNNAKDYCDSSAMVTNKVIESTKSYL